MGVELTKRQILETYIEVVGGYRSGQTRADDLLHDYEKLKELMLKAQSDFDHAAYDPEWPRESQCELTTDKMILNASMRANEFASKSGVMKEIIG